jgi:uncharacterized protein YndB with AHSA1/START domain
VTYIRTAPERLWSALTTPDFTEQFWFGMHFETDWKSGSPWELVFRDGRVADTGEIVEIDPPSSNPLPSSGQSQVSGILRGGAQTARV